uniref:Sec20 C-terminal domain-containing protein n=1 Tax=Craspedostauros australis TaxID=1486917 RepID=A0A6T6I4F4_9STRA|mmetsp:Transcript_9560/g.26010  ORF Transcript_9560/g.26010 Transcript_9560/m.26010 type:complete len:141 (+) Transcript_9560:208-630(+)
MAQGNSTSAVEHMRNRKKLLSRSRAKAGGSKSSSQATTASEAQFIQKSLQRTQTLLQDGLHRVNHVSSAIDDDEKALQQLMDDQKSLEVKQAEKALSALRRAQQRERNVLTASIVFFLWVVFYIMYVRVLYRFNIFAYFF